MKSLGQNNISRRAFIAGTGASMILASTYAGRGFADQTLPTGNGDAAYEPWTTWAGEPSDGPLALVRAAVVAANAHNTQPWFFRVTPSRIEVVADTSRNIGTVDPMLREMHIGIGCALENLALRRRLTVMPARSRCTKMTRPSRLPTSLPRRYRSHRSSTRSATGIQIAALTIRRGRSAPTR